MPSARRCGTRSAYVGGCRCPSCRAAHADYTRRKRTRASTTNLVDAMAVRRHLLALARAGAGRNTIADLTYTGAASIHAIRTGARRRVRASLAARILALTVEAALARRAELQLGDRRSRRTS